LVEENRFNPNAVNANNDTPLHIAARKNDDALVEVLIKAGANVNVMNRDGDCPTHVAASHGSDRVMLKLVNAGAEINGRNFNLDTPLILAAKNGHGTIDIVLSPLTLSKETLLMSYQRERLM
jgi:ankyrin repeat protein